MRQRRLSMPALITAAAGAACLALATPAVAAAADPPGNNGDVKIDGRPFDEDNNNEPHVECDFRVKFFNFDEDQTADIIFNIHPPSGSGQELFRLDDQVVSDDPAGGGQDLDEIFTFSANQFGLEAFEAHPKQGFHIKLTVLSEGVPGGKKHKVFWLKPCPKPSPTTPTPSPTRTKPTSPAASPTALPVTGTPAADTVAMLSLGLGLIGGGAALMVLRRRRDNLA